MKAGRFVGVNESSRLVVKNSSFMMMEEFMYKKGVENSQHIVWIDVRVREEFEKKGKDINSQEYRSTVATVQSRLHRELALKIKGVDLNSVNLKGIIATL